ncbi:Transcription factor lepE like protein [Verticillium longisporum]|nr:Transcription factor lepE like protein [Verticillium longisporum]
MPMPTTELGGVRPSQAERKRRRPALACEQCLVPRQVAPATSNPATAASDHVAPDIVRPSHVSASGSIPPHTDPDWFTPYPSNRPDHEPILTPESLPSTSPTVTALLDRVKQLEQQLNVALQKNDASRDCAAMCRDEPREDDHTHRGLVDKTRLFGPSHWANGVTMVEGIFKFLHGVEADKTSRMYQDMERCKSLGRLIKGQRVPALTSIVIGKSIPQKDLADQLVDAYLRTFESVYRVVHIPSFKAEYERYWVDPSAANESFVVLLQLCMAIGAAFQDDTFSLRTIATQWIYEAQVWLMLPAGALLRTAMYMGLHEDPKCIAKMSAFRAEMRRRLWATILEILLASSISSGGPPLISPMDYDTEPPANVDDEQLIEDAESAFPVPKPSEVYTQMSVPRAMLETFQVRLVVAKHINDIRANASYNETLRVNADLTASLQGMMRQLKKLHEGGELSSFQLRYVEYTTWRFFIVLHRPALARALRNPVYYFSRKVCVDTCLLLANSMFVAPKSLARLASPAATPSDMDVQRLFINCAGSYRSTMVQGGMILGMEYLLVLRENSGFHATGAVGGGTAELRETIDAVKPWCAKRVRAGDTNMKSYLAFVWLSAQIDCFERGLSSEETDAFTVEAVETEISKCHDWLKTLAGCEETSVAGEMAFDMAQDIDFDDLGGFDKMSDWDWGDLSASQGFNSSFDVNGAFGDDNIP